MKKAIGIICVALTVFFVMPCTIALSVSGSVSNAKGSDGLDKLVLTADHQSVYGQLVTDFKNSDRDYLLNDKNQVSSEAAKDMLIKVYFAKEDVTKSMYLEDYIAGVVLGEMLVSCEKEALKAQAVAARSYTLYMMKHGGIGIHENGAAICTDYRHCQAYKSPADILKSYPDELAIEYHKKLFDAVRETKGQILTYEGEIVKAYYFDNSGGFTESYNNVWGGENHGYTQSVPCIGEADKDNFCTLSYFETEDFLNRFKEASGEVEATPETVFSTVKILSRTDSNRINEISVGGVTFKGTEMRSILGLKSTNVIFRELDDGRILTVTFGSGHGVGMSQWGAESMAERGSTYDEILKYYYTGVELSAYTDYLE